jgi:curved DNA-binding protein CbpA
MQSGPAISDMPPAATESLIVRTATPEPIAEDRLSQPPSLRDPLDERRQAIVGRAEAIAGKNHYEVLGVEQDAPVAEIQKAFLASVKVFHPDRLPEPLADLRDVASRVFSAVVEAHKTLTDAPARSAYDATLATDGTAADAAEQAEIERVLRASSSFQKAEILLRRNDVDGAETLAREAVDLDPQPDHLALLGWVHALRNRLPEALDHLNRSIDASPQAEAALFYRGTVLKRMGHQSKALSDFRRVAELNPKNLDAVREVRLHERRGQEAEDAKPGLLGKLFSKKK